MTEASNYWRRTAAAFVLIKKTPEAADGLDDDWSRSGPVSITLVVQYSRARTADGVIGCPVLLLGTRGAWNLPCRLPSRVRAQARFRSKGPALPLTVTAQIGRVPPLGCPSRVVCSRCFVSRRACSISVSAQR
jgi:hypothetical protein